MKKTYVSEIIKDDYKNKWKLGDRIVIKAQTGSGKSTFFGNTISVYSEEHGLNALMLSNRNLLKLQNRLLFKVNIDCINYQTFESISIKQNKTIDSLLDKYDIIFIDECHYFYTDSAFNPNTNLILQYLKKEHNDKILIFASATPDMIFYSIQKEKFNYIYEIPYDYSFIKKIVFYESDEDVENIIKNIPPTEKAIYFASKVVDSAMYSNKFKNSKFICSQYNRQFKKFSDMNIYNQIVKNEKFSCKILMTTSVLDNGINIKDEKLKHILIDIMDATTLIQCIGRKRIESDNDGIIIYCRKPSKRQIMGSLFGNINRMKFAKRESDKVMADYISNQWNEVKRIGYENYICNIFDYNINMAIWYKINARGNTIKDVLEKYLNIKLFEDGQDEFMRIFKEMVYNQDSKEYDKYNFKSLAANIEEYGLPYKLLKHRERAGNNRNKWYWMITKKIF